MARLILVFLAFSISFAFAAPDLNKIRLPKGFKIELYATGLDSARQMAISPSGTLFVGSKAGYVYAVKNKKNFTIARNLQMPVGVAFHKGDLYISSISKIVKIANVERHIDNPVEPEVIFAELPTDRHHGWKYIAIGPDEKLYIPVGAPCNICLSEKSIYATLNRINLDGSGFETVAHGVRNTVGFDWQPSTQKLWFTENGRDSLGDDVPPDELNRVDELGQHYGYPFCHGGTIQDPEFKKPCAEFKPPVQNLGPHVAALGMKFYDGKMFPLEYRGKVFIAEHGSWNRSKKIGYRISQVDIQGQRSNGYSTFAEGWLSSDSQSVMGRPVDLLVIKDGSMLVSDDEAGVIYRISYR